MLVVVVIIVFIILIVSRCCICRLVLVTLAGFLEKEIVKDGIEMLDMGENPEAPASREMSDLEVSATVAVIVCLVVWS